MFSRPSGKMNIICPLLYITRAYKLVTELTSLICFQRVMKRAYQLRSLRTVFLSSRNLNPREKFCSDAQNHHGDYEWQDPKSEDEVVNVTVVTKDNKKTQIRGKIGDNLLYLCRRFNIDMEGACEASLACTTCHCYVDFEYLSKLPIAEDKEKDLLDMAPFLKENSRLGCQIKLTKELNGIVITLPLATRNFYVDGHNPQPH